MASDVGERRPAYPMERPRPLDPPPLYRQLRREAPLSKVRLWNGSESWLATRYADVRAILQDPRFSIVPSRPGFPSVSKGRAAVTTSETHNFSYNDAPVHTQLRRMLVKMFTVGRILNMREPIEVLVDELIDEIKRTGPPSELTEAFALPLPALVIADLLGVPREDREFFQACTKQRGILSESAEVTQAGGQGVFGYLLDLIGRIEDEGCGGDSLLERLVAEQVRPGHLSREGAAGMGAALLVAGHHTTASMISVGLLVLLQNPQQLAALKADRTLIGDTVEELLRYVSIAHHHVPRAALEDVEVGGQLIRAGEGVISSIPAANRDPEVFPDPETFDIHNNARMHLAFGFGAHQCIGQALARLEMEIAFDTLLRRLPDLQLAIPANDIQFNFDDMIWGVKSLPVTW